MEAPSIPEPTLGQKLSLLWETNKPALIAIIVLITLIFFGIIFCIVYFAIIKPNQHHDDSSTEKTAKHTAEILFHGLRSYQHS